MNIEKITTVELYNLERKYDLPKSFEDSAILKGIRAEIKERDGDKSIEARMEADRIGDLEDSTVGPVIPENILRSFTLEIEPKSVQFGNSRVNFRTRAFFADQATKNYKTAIGLLSAKYRPGKLFVGPLAVDFIFILPRPKSLYRKADPEGLIPCACRPDRDNLQKGTQDALVGFWKDDAQIVDGRTAKFYAEKNGYARIIVTIKQIDAEVAG